YAHVLKSFQGGQNAEQANQHQTYRGNNISLIPCVIRRKFCDPYGFWLALGCYVFAISLGAVVGSIDFRYRWLESFLLALSIGLILLGARIQLEWPECDRTNGDPCKADQQAPFHNPNNVTHKKDLTSLILCNTLTRIEGDTMANILNEEKQTA